MKVREFIQISRRGTVHVDDGVHDAYKCFQ